MRIAIYSPFGRDPEGTHGGVTPYVLNLSRGLLEAGQQVDLVISPRDRQWRDRVAGLRERGLRVRELPLAGTRQTVRALAAGLRLDRPDVLLAAGHRYNRLAVRAARSAGADVGRRVPVFVTLHNPVQPVFRHKPALRRYLRYWSMRRYCQQAAGVIAVSRGVADDVSAVVGLGRDDIAVIRNPLLSAEVLAQARGECGHPWLRDKGAEPVLLSVGRLSAQKAYPVLLRAFALLVRRRRARLVVLGEGPERASLEALAGRLGIERQVSLPGFVANPLSCMREASAFVLSSAWEGLGNVLVEALAVDCPVVATDCPGGVREVLDDGRCGRLVPANDPVALADAVDEVLDAPRTPARCDGLLGEYRIDRVAGHYLAHFERKLEERSDRRRSP